VPGEGVVNIDKITHKENGQRFWTGWFHAQMYTLFRIDKSRGSKVLMEVLGENSSGVLDGDYLHAGLRRAGAVLPGPPDPRRTIPPDLACT
jgi:hypothetical protein